METPDNITNTDLDVLMKDGPIEHHEVTEALLQKFEEHMKDMRLRAITLHTSRMERVVNVLRNSGMDSQQQNRLKAEISQIFHPFNE